MPVHTNKTQNLGCIGTPTAFLSFLKRLNFCDEDNLSKSDLHLKGKSLLP